MGMKVEKAGGIEIYSAQNYLKTRNNWGIGGLLLHEYSHAYHYKHCANGYKNEEILEVNLTLNIQFFFFTHLYFFNACYVLYFSYKCRYSIFTIYFSAINSFLYLLLILFSFFTN